ncbi:MAG: CapA family protein [bacterium]|nr:MAG: CapA family protein [bacterium]
MNRWIHACVLAVSLWLFLIRPGSSQFSSNEDTFIMMLTGDCIITRKLSVYHEPEFLRMIELIRSANVAFTNLEMLFHDYEAYPMHQSGGTYMRADPFLAKELTWAGFDMVSRANNHAGDYGALGMRLTTKYVEQAGLVHAGVGESLTQAREAKFLETAKARVALISCASTFPDHSRAGKTRGDIPTRPGLNPIRFSTTYMVNQEQFDTLQQLAKDFGLRFRKDSNKLWLFRQQFEVGDSLELRTQPHKADLQEIGDVVSNASRLADYTIVSFHGHESNKDRPIPAQFLIKFCHAMIDSGADICVGHGPHVLRGIEIYKGKPIFYSLGDFMFQNETLLRLPYENYEYYKLGSNAHVADFNDARYDFDKKGFPAKREIWESVIAVPVWKGKKLVEIKLFPITLGFGKPRTVRGRPMFADLELSKKIIEDLVRLSEPYRTAIEFKNGIGVVKLQSN